MTAISTQHDFYTLTRRAPAFSDPREFYTRGEPVTIIDVQSGPEGLQSVKSIFKSTRSDQIWHLSRLRDGWDTYDAPAPNATAVENALRILQLLNTRDLIRVKILPSAEGGIGFCFTMGGRYADLECSNDGHILGVRYEGNEAPVLIQPNNSDHSLVSALAEIRTYIFG